jgi:hypothetical protein
MVIESGVANSINQDYCNQIVDGLFSLMESLGIWQKADADDKTGLRNSRIVKDSDITYINSESSGIFISEKRVYDKVKKGDELGRIVDVITGSVEEIVYAAGDGMVCSMRNYPVIEEGSLIARIIGDGDGDFDE